MPKVVSFPKTKAEREAEKQRVRTLYCAGHSITDAARMVGVKQQTAFKWQQRDGWKQEISQAQALAQRPSNFVQPDTRIAFDLSNTKKETRASFARTSLKIAQWAEQEAQSTPEVLFEMGSQYKAHVESAAKVAGDWESTEGNRFAIDLHINNLVSSGQIREVGEDVTVIEEQ